MQISLEPGIGREAILTCGLRAAPEQVFRALTEAALLQRWMRGPPGWRMACCLSEAHPGGRLRCEWCGQEGGHFSISGDYLTVEPPWHFVHLERLQPPGAGAFGLNDNLIDTRLRPVGTSRCGTRLCITYTLPTTRARNAMLLAAAAGRLADSYDRLDALFVA